MADVHGSPGSAPQQPQAAAGPAPVPYAGPDEGAGNVTYAATGVSWRLPGSADVMAGVSGNAVQEAGYAHDVNAGLVTSYDPGAVSPVGVHGDPDAGGRDDVAGTVAGAVANAEARYLEHEGDTHATGSTVGDVMNLPPGPLDPGTVGGLTDPSGAYFDPPRSY
jgi:hypothetical protein